MIKIKNNFLDNPKKKKKRKGLLKKQLAIEINKKNF